MAKVARGFYRTKGGEGAPNDAWVSDGTIGMDIPEQLYRERGYVPDFDQLPWKADYDRAEAAVKAKDKDAKGS